MTPLFFFFFLKKKGGWEKGGEGQISPPHHIFFLKNIVYYYDWKCSHSFLSINTLMVMVKVVNGEGGFYFVVQFF